jgi:uncharacterized small protein (DUF1192 family)
MAELFGGFGGIRLWEQDKQAAQAAALARQEALGRIAMQPAQQRLGAAQAEMAEMALGEQRRLPGLMRRGATTGRTPTEMFLSLSRMAAEEVMAEQSKEFATVASQLMQREAATVASRAAALNSQLEAVATEADLFSRFLGTAKSEDEWNQGNVLYEIHTGRPSVYRDIFEPGGFDPRFVERLNEFSVSAKDRADDIRLRETQGNLEAYRKERLKQIDEQNRIAALRAQIEREREERLKKAAGSRAVPGPVAEEIFQAQALIKRTYPNFDPSALDSEAYKIASEARALRHQNKALDANKAIYQAFRNAIARGDYESVGVLPSWVPEDVPGRKVTRPKGEGKVEVEEEEILPQEKEVAPSKHPALPDDRSKWKAGEIYDLGEDRGPYKWDGKVFRRVD